MDEQDFRIKKATNSRQADKLTAEQAQEFMKCAQSMDYFARTYVKVQSPELGVTEFIPRNYQKKIMSLVEKNRFVIVDAPRQCGKSSSISVILLWYLVFNNDFKIGIAANIQAAAKEDLSRIKYAYECLPYWLKPAVDKYNELSISFENGSRIETCATTASSFRGKSLNILYLDEFAHVKQGVAEEFWTSILPTISAAGSSATSKVIITSTPNGTEGTFASLWFSAIAEENGFSHYRVKTKDIPDRGAKFKQQMLRKMSLTKYLQEYEGEFLSDKSTLISSMVLEGLRTRQPSRKLDGDVGLFCDSFKDRIVALACDVGTGIGADYHCIQIFDVQSLEQLGEFRNNSLTQSEFALKIVRLIERIYSEKPKDVYWSVESTGVGVGVLNLLANVRNSSVFDNATRISSRHSKLGGISMSGPTKSRACMKFKDLIETHKMTLHSAPLISELKFFVKSGQGFSAEKSLHDDLVMGCMNFVAMLEELAGYEDSVYEVMNQISSLEVSEDGESASDYEPLPFVF